MSSNIRIKRVCKHCGNEFTAHTTSTQYCNSKCASKAAKKRKRAEKIELSNHETLKIKTQPIEVLKTKEFLTVREVAALLNCSIRSVYYYIENGNINAVNLGKRITRVKRSDIDKLFEQTQQMPDSELRDVKKEYDLSECYSTEQVRDKYNISETGLRNLIIKYNIPKKRKGWYAYVPKSIIDNLLS